MTKSDVSKRCVVCGKPLPSLTREEMYEKGYGTFHEETRQDFYHCKAGHTPAEIAAVIEGRPTGGFFPGNKIRRGLT